MCIVTVTHGAEAHGKANNGGGKDKDKSAHGRRAGLCHVPRRANFLDLLSGLHFSQPGNIKPADYKCDYKCENKRKRKLQCHLFFLFSICSATISLSSMWCFSWPTT